MGTGKPKPWTVLEQVVNDLASGLAIHFEVLSDGSRRLRLVGDVLPCRNREFRFDSDGRYTGGGTDMRRDPPKFMR
jgi:hypothetical protein